MSLFRIYFEEADSDEERRYLGDIWAHTMSEALQKASEYWEVSSHDLVAIQVLPREVKIDDV